MFCKLFFAYAPGSRTPDTSMPHWLSSGYVWSQVTAYSGLVPFNCFAVINPEASRSLTNSIAASVFPSGLL